MSQIRSFTPEEGKKVRKFILAFLKKHPHATDENIMYAVERRFAKIDCVSATHHILRDLENERVIKSRVVATYTLSKIEE